MKCAFAISLQSPKIFRCISIIAIDVPQWGCCLNFDFTKALKTRLPNPEKPIGWVISVSLDEKPAMGGAWQPSCVWIKLVNGY